MIIRDWQNENEAFLKVNLLLLKNVCIPNPNNRLLIKNPRNGIKKIKLVIIKKPETTRLRSEGLLKIFVFLGTKKP